MKHAWMTSFGDTLTLLLCFFLCFVSFGPLNSSNQEKLNSNSINKSSERDGIGLAEVESEKKEVELLFKEADYIKLDNENQIDVAAKLNKVVDFNSYELKKSVIETCYDMEKSFEAESWFESMNRSLDIRRQLIDIGVPAKKIFMRSVGPWCGILKFNSNERMFVSRLVIELGVKANG